MLHCVTLLYNFVVLPHFYSSTSYFHIPANKVIFLTPVSGQRAIQAEQRGSSCEVGKWELNDVECPFKVEAVSKGIQRDSLF